MTKQTLTILAGLVLAHLAACSSGGGVGGGDAGGGSDGGDGGPPEAAPSASFSASPLVALVPAEVAFSDASTGPITTWSWDFGDGATSSDPEPVHTYTDAGSYTVTLTVSGPGGSDAFVRTDYLSLYEDGAEDPGAWPNEGSPVGINLGTLSYHSKAWSFVDIFKTSRPWQLHENGGPVSDPVDLTPDGWVASLGPGQEAVTYMYLGVSGQYPGGAYNVFYDGNGVLEFSGDAQVVSEQVGHVLLDVSPSNGITLRLAQTDPADPLRNIRVVMPGFEDVYEDEPFHPLFLARAAKFSILRFMPWQKINHSPIVEWSERTTPEYAQQSVDSGVAVEHAIELANTLHADPWLCIPHLASDDYVARFAEVVRDRLDPDLRCYIEYSNEVWNWGFSQADYAYAQGQLLWPEESAYIQLGRFYSQRSVEVFTIFEEVFGGTERLVRVLGGQRGAVGSTGIICSWQDAYDHADVFAIAAYFGRGLDEYPIEEVEQWPVDQMLDWCTEQVVVHREGGIIPSIQTAAAHGLPTVAYEGGLALAGYANNPTLVALFEETTRHPRMKDIYLDQLNGWKDAGGGVFVAFNYLQKWVDHGRWGVLERQDQPTEEAPKYAALIEFIDAE
ncbi:MAG: PKD domain-containing protein [Planctomycetota bacterium]|nr:PKD domain-containing protein [Planctomycetota bacterium]